MEEENFPFGSMATETSPINFRALIARKEYIFEELTRIYEIVKPSNFKDAIEADIQLAALDKHEVLFNELIKEILTANTIAPKGQKVNTKDLQTFRVQFDTIRKCCLKCKSNYNKEKTEPSGGSGLPDINLPVFAGDIGEWPSFIAQFNAAVHRKRIPKVEKLTYLRSTLRKEPLALAFQYDLEENAYDLVYDALVKRYSNPRLLASHYVNQMLGFKFEKSYSKFMTVHRAATAGVTKLGIQNLSDYLLFERAYRNLPIQEQKIFDKKFGPTQLPTLQNLFDHIDNAAQSEELHADTTGPNIKIGPKSKHHQVFLGVSDDANRTCVYCKEKHPLFRCTTFSELPRNKKLDIVKRYAVCTQCLGIHKKGNCWSKYSCRHCHAKEHHSFLCDKSSPQANLLTLSHDVDKVTRQEDNDNQAHRTFNACLSTCASTVLLGTIKAKVVDIWGSSHNVRVVCDTGSQVNIVTNSLARGLGLKRSNAKVDVQSVAQGTPKILGSVTLKIQSLADRDISYEFDAVVIPSICSELPTEKINIQLPDALKKLPLADPEFGKTQKIDILLGADAFMDILSVNEPMLIKNQPTAINTIFGYVLTGRVSPNSATRAFSFCTTSLDKTLKSFWEVENVTRQEPIEDESCEEHFRNTSGRDASGRYIVRLPFQDNCPPLGSNLSTGLKSFAKLEHRFRTTPGLLQSYSAVLQDYLDQGHMSTADQNQNYILPHHCVYKDSSSTAIRVVFNASSVDDTGTSLNSRLKSGPKLQNDLPKLLINFRFFEIALQADIKQMFRNILLHPEDRKFQQILWRWSPEEEIQQFSLNTVTFGFTCSPYLAQRVLKQLVADEGSLHPEAGEAVLHHTFMDDFVTGAPTVEAAKSLMSDLNNLLAKGGFELRKWVSSHPEVLDTLPEDHREKPFIFPTGEEGVKILGLLWEQDSDSLRYHVSDPQLSKITKRSILSYVARIWDCLGLVSPVVLKAKLFLQRLWLLQVDWDEEIPSTLSEDWSALVSEMPLLRQLKISRKIPITDGQLRIVGFSDASESAMAASVYLHITRSDGSVESHLLMSKTKLAPLKSWTIPRLELAAAVLLTTLVEYIRFSKLKDLPVYLFSDSQIVLAWLRIPPHNLKLFVANRVLQIKETLPEAIWNFIPGNINPADLASRGLKPSQILNNNSWWYGPEFLKEPVDRWPMSTGNELTLEECPEIKAKKITQTLVTQIVIPEPVTDYLNKPSSLGKLQRVIAFILRFTFNSKNKQRLTGPLSATELEAALFTCVRLTQQIHFQADIKALREAKNPKVLHKLTPFLDSNQLLRAGGRIRRAESLTEDAKHPLILPKNCHLSALICDFYHRLLLHAGVRTTMAAIQQKFWIISLRQLVKKRIRLCLRCFKLSAAPHQPLMGELPKERVNVARPFTHITVDFGGPIITKESRLRTSVKHKSYMCVFVCMTVKAVHLEAVTELSTNAFLAAFSRFTSRRGLPKRVWSDCGRNFVGAAGKLDNLQSLELNGSLVQEFAAKQNIEWQFSPPYAPNFNGLAEAAIKSTKRLLIRQIGDEVLTFEEFATLLCRIEAVLNSRPLTALPDDPSEVNAYLSPAHFLLGQQIIHPPEEPDEALSLKDRWQRVQLKARAFWNQWSKEYLNTLLQRQRWTKPASNLRVGQVVFITGENPQALQWPLGRIVQLHPGEDGVTRVATIRWAKGEMRRPVNRLISLPQSE